MDSIEMAFRAACKKNDRFTAIVENAAQNIKIAKVEAEAKAKAEAAAKAAELEALFGFSYSPVDYSMCCGIIWAESLEAAKEKVSHYPNVSVWELDRAKDVIVVGTYIE